MIVCVLRVLPVVSPVANRRVKTRVEVIGNDTYDKQTFDVPIVGVTYNLVLRWIATRNV